MMLPAADAATEPSSPHLRHNGRESWFGHPRQLARLFSTEAWERFGFYGLRALLVLYLTEHFLLDDHAANGLFGGYMSLVYLTPLVGGWLADRYLGSKRSVKFGALMMALGYFTLCFGGEQAKPFAIVDGQRHGIEQQQTGGKTRQYLIIDDHHLLIRGDSDGSVQLVAPDGRIVRTLPRGGFRADAARSPLHIALMLIALSLVAIGNGFFKPNISTIVGALYRDDDRRRDAGFTIFYMGINIGSIGSQTFCPLLVGWFGWWAGFLLVAVGMLVAYALMQFDGGRLAGYGEPPADAGRHQAPVVYALATLAVPVVWLVLANVMTTSVPAAGIGFLGYLAGIPLLGKLLLIVFAGAMIGIPLWSAAVGTRAEWQMMLAAIILVIFNVVFWTLTEQAGSALTLFADRNVDLTLFGMPISAAQTQNFNPITIVLFAPVLSALWLWLARRGREPSTPVKFALALIGVGAGFVVLAWSGRFADAGYRVSLWWLILSYFLQSLAELAISPVGLSMITKLSIARVVGMMMGVWFLSFSVAEYLAGAIAQSASVQTIGGQVTNAKLSLDTYIASFSMSGIATIGIGAALLCLSPLIRRLMHGVD